VIRRVLALIRVLRHSPASAAAASVSLALTLGASTTIFTVVDAILLTPPPFADPDAVVTLAETPVAVPGAPRMISYPTFDAWRARAGSLARLAAFDGTVLTLTGLGAAERVGAIDIDSEFLPLLGITPVMGRSFGSNDVGQPVVLVSDQFWRARLNADRAVLGRTIVLNGRSYTIVGVVAKGFAFPLDADFWRPMPFTAAQAARTTYRMRAIARLAPGVTPQLLAAALDDVSTHAAPPSRAIATRIASTIVGGATGTLRLLAAAAAIAMLMAFANLIGLLLVRSMDRAEDLVVRVALGARPSAVVIDLVLEAEALVLIGTVIGLLLAIWMTPTVGHVVQQQFGNIANRDITVNWPIVIGVALLAAASAALAAVLPAVLAAQRATLPSLRRGVTRPPQERALRRAVIVGEVALTFVLLVSMALLARSLATMLERHPGFRADGLLTMGVSLPAARYAGDPQEVAFYASLQHSLDERLGVGTNAVVDELPLTGDGGRSLVGLTPTDARAEAVARVAGPSYFDVMTIPLVSGRAFDARDDSSAPQRVVVSARLANQLFGAASPIGRTVWLTGPRQSFQVIGVVGDVMHRALDEPPLATAYLSAWQWPSRSSRIVVRSNRPAAEAIAIVREEIAKLDPNLPVGVRPMPDIVAASAGVPALRVLTDTFAAFALLALALSAVGVFGIVAHDVAARRPEFAVRLALGAHPRRLLVATIRQGATIIGVGLFVGLGLSWWSGQLLATLAPATNRVDLMAIATSAAVLLLVGLSATLPPARRAARTDPLASLRAD